MNQTEKLYAIKSASAWSGLRNAIIKSRPTSLLTGSRLRNFKEMGISDDVVDREALKVLLTRLGVGAGGVGLGGLGVSQISDEGEKT